MSLAPRWIEPSRIRYGMVGVHVFHATYALAWRYIYPMTRLLYNRGYLSAQFFAHPQPLSSVYNTAQKWPPLTTFPRTWKLCGTSLPPSSTSDESPFLKSTMKKSWSRVSRGVGAGLDGGLTFCFAVTLSGWCGTDQHIHEGEFNVSCPEQRTRNSGLIPRPLAVIPLDPRTRSRRSSCRLRQERQGFPVG